MYRVSVGSTTLEIDGFDLLDLLLDIQRRMNNAVIVRSRTGFSICGLGLAQCVNVTAVRL